MAGFDFAHKETDKIIERIEKEIAKEYRHAHKEVERKLSNYLERFRVQDEQWRALVKKGEKTKAEYRKWRTGQILMGERWAEMSSTLAQDYTNTAKIAQSIATGHRAEVYALNHNYATFDIEKQSKLDTSYTLYSRESVERMYRENPKLYHDPGKKAALAIREGKQKDWDKRRIRSVITQGILQGESIPDLSKRLQRVTGGDYSAAVRNARTMMTGAQNAGRIDAQERAKSLGIPLKKQWLATLDSRTRHWHADLDGETAETDEPFVNDYGEIMYPGDPDADPANIMNCRCTLLTAIKEHELDASDLSLRHDERLGDMTYDEWKDSRSSSTYGSSGGSASTRGTGTQSGEPILDELRASDIKYIPVRSAKGYRTTEQIVKTLGGEDKTNGSCTSLTLAYVGNRSGYVVRDFRGGKSQQYFSRGSTLEKIAKMDGVNGTVLKGGVEKDAAHMLMGMMKPNKEYIFGTGTHTAIARVNPKGAGYEYLELQTKGKNGFKALDDAALSIRFECTDARTNGKHLLIDTERLKGNNEFRDILGYINTSIFTQKKS